MSGAHVGLVKEWEGARALRLTPRVAACGFVLVLALLAHWPALTRSGYSPDEEISIFAVRGISATGLPRLPSGLFYDRGVLFSYTAWFSGRIFGDRLPSYRLPSLAGGVAIAILTGLVAARLGGNWWPAALLAATATWLVAAATWARFYALFVAAFLATAATLLDHLAPQSRRGRWFLVGLVVARLFHEMALTLLALPLFLFLESRPDTEERRWAKTLTLRSLALLAAVQVVLVLLAGGGTAFSTPELVGLAGGAPSVVPALLHLGSPIGLALLGLSALGIGLALRPLGASWAVCAAATAISITLNLGLLLVAVAALLLVRPAGARATGLAGLVVALATLAAWTAFVAVHTPSGFGETARSLGLAGLAYPLAGAAAMARLWPLTALAAFGGLLVGRKDRNVRAVAFLALALLVFLGAIDVSPRPRYLLALLPLLFATAALLPAVMALRARAWWRPAGVAAKGLSLILVGILYLEHDRGRQDFLLEPGSLLTPPHFKTVPFEGWAESLAGRVVGGPVVCTDDLACLLVGQTPDYWWLGSEGEAAQYGFRLGGDWHSTYTGARILVGSQGNGSIPCEKWRDAWIIALDTPKYPPSSDMIGTRDPHARETQLRVAGMTVLHGRNQRPDELFDSLRKGVPCPPG